MKKIDSLRLENSAGFALWQASTHWRRLVELALIEIGLTYSQFVLLASLGEISSSKSEVSQVELARHCSADITMTSYILRTLEKKGYIERKTQKGNEKSKFPKVTKLGSSLIEQALPIVERIDQQFFGALSETKQCHKILTTLAQQARFISKKQTDPQNSTKNQN